jgi:two-component system NtrC family sensor kinase
VGVVTSLIVNSIVTNQIILEAQERVKEDLNTARWVYDSKIKDISKVFYWTSIRHVLKQAVKTKDATPIQKEFLVMMREEGIDFLLVTDRKGVVLFRFHNLKLRGDDLSQDPFIKAALQKKGISGTQILSSEQLAKEGEGLAKRAFFQLIPTPKERPTEKLEETSGMVIKAAYPIIDFDGEVLGALAGGVLLNRNYEIVDRIKNIVFKDARYREKEIGTATIFMGDLRISTNVMDKEGNRATGTRAMKEVEEQVLQKGQPWIRRAFVVDDWYITAYEPIQDVEEKIVGMLYVGLLESKYAFIKERLILSFFLFSMAGMLIALVVSFVLSWKIVRK